MEPRRTYTINEVAALTGLHKNTVRQRVRFGQLRAAILPGKYGEEYRITHEALVESGLLAAPAAALDEPLVAEFEPATEESAPPQGGAVGSLTELYQRHEHAMFRLGYLQGELHRMKALAETAESLQRDNQERRQEADTLRAALAEQEQRETAARAELTAARARLAELDTLREGLAQLRALADEQEAVIRALDAEHARKRLWWRRG